MEERRKSKDVLVQAALVLGGILVALMLCEIVLRLFAKSSPVPLDPTLSSKTPLHTLTDAAYLYGLNPDHPEISSQGLRDREFRIPKQEGVIRILVLGDSVTFGSGVKRDETFPKVLETELKSAGHAAEVINAGVNGYTAYNEVEYYLHKGRSFQPDLVVVAFCLNDVVDPKLHWNYTSDKIKNIPEESIPNPAYHNTRNGTEYENNPTIGADRAYRGGNPRGILDRSKLYRLLRSRLGGGQFVIRVEDETWYDKVGGKWWPTYITGEDPISIRVLLDYDSPEWKWLRRMYDRLVGAVRKDGARLVVLQIPLAYQLDRDYPFKPQELMRRFCEERSVEWLDAVPALRRRGAKEVFFLRCQVRGREIYDIWHLTPQGHRVVARELARFLVEEDLLAKP